MLGPELMGRTSGGVRVYLERPVSTNAERPFNMLQHPSFHPELMMGGVPPDLEKYRAFIEERVQHDTTRHAWWLTVDGEFAGIAGLFRIRERRFELSQEICIGMAGQIFYAVHPDFRRRGIARAAATEIVRFALEDLKHMGVYTEVLLQNEAGAALLDQLNFAKGEVIPEGDEDAYTENDIYFPSRRRYLTSLTWRSRRPRFLVA